MKTLVVVLALSFFFQRVSSQVIQVGVDQSHETIAKTIAAIVPKFHTYGKDSITLVNKPLFHGILAPRTDQIVTAILRLLHTFSPVILADGITSTTSVGSRISNVIVVDSYVTFREIFLKMNTKFEGYQGLFLVVLTSYENQADQTKAILEDFNSNYLMRVNVVFLKTPNEAKIFTFFPFTPTSCGEVHPVLLDTYITGYGFLENKSLIPSKTKQMYQCPMKIAAVNFPPFVIIDKNREGSKKFSGIDARVLKTLALVMNFSLDVETFNNTGWGELALDGTSSGVLEKIINRKANITAGFFVFNEIRNRFMTPSFPYYTTKLVWVVSPGVTISIFERLYMPFELEVWYGVLAFLLIGFFLIAAIERRSKVVRNFVFGRQVKFPTLQMINILLGGVMNRTPTRNFARTMLALYLFYSLVLRSAYTEALYRFLRNNDRSQKVQTMADMLEQNYTFLVPEILKEDFIAPFPDIMNRTTFLNISTHDAARQWIQESDENYALLVTLDEVGYWNKNMQRGQKFVFLQEIAFNINLVFYMHKQTFFAYEVSRIILWLNSNGYMEELENHYKAIYDPQIAVARGPKKLNFEHLEGAFYILLSGAAASIISFLLELVIKKYAKSIKIAYRCPKIKIVMA